MLSTKLIQMIEDHADQLTERLVQELGHNPRTDAYHKIPVAELQLRAADVYRNLGRWLTTESEDVIESSYIDLGRRRSQEQVPASQVVYALTLTKEPLVSLREASRALRLGYLLLSSMGNRSFFIRWCGSLTRQSITLSARTRK